MLQQVRYDMIKVDLITGFLGAGKTTFLKKYARFLINQGLKIGILEYDYGAINIDMVLLGELRGPKCELEMVAAGCDNDCLIRRFKTKLISMAMSGYDRVIIEPSGVFDMDMFFDSLREEPLENWYEIGSVITIVNADLEDNLGNQADYYLASQATSAGCIVLSKTQLCTDSEIESTKNHLKNAARKINCNNFREKYLEKAWDELTDSDYLMLASSGYHINDCVKIIGAMDEEFSSINFLDVPSGKDALIDKIKQIFAEDTYGKIYRVKGFVGDRDGNYEISATANKLAVTPSNAGRGTVIIIGTSLNEEKIKRLFFE